MCFSSKSICFRSFWVMDKLRSRFITYFQKLIRPQSSLICQTVPHPPTNSVAWKYNIPKKLGNIIYRYRMHRKMVFNFTVRHDHAFKSCQTR